MASADYICFAVQEVLERDLLFVLQVAESWAFGMLVLFAGLLPDPTRAVASTSIAFNTYGITYMPFLAESIAVSTRCASSERPFKHWLNRSCNVGYRNQL